MGEVLEQVENRGLSFLILWILPLFAAIGVLAILIWIVDAVKELKHKVVGEYTPQATVIQTQLGATVHPISVIKGSGNGLKHELWTVNGKARHIESKTPIRALRFNKPKDIIIRRDDLPVIFDCENSFWKRLRNRLLFIPNPRIIVKAFTEKGVIWDEENTNGQYIEIEFYP